MSWSPPALWSPSVGTISPWSLESLGVQLNSVGSTGAPAGNAWPSNNLGIFVPFELSNAVTCPAMFYYSNAATGNYDIGLFTSAGAKIVTKGSTALASGWQNVSITSTLLQPGRYYMALALSSNQSIFAVNPAFPIGAALGVKQSVSAVPLPASATLVDLTQAYLPMFGLSISTVAL